MKVVGWLLAAFGAEIVCILISRKLHLPNFASTVFTTLPALLLLFPFLRRWMPRTRFRHWALATVIGSVFVGAAFFLLARLGWN
ncbi:MAG TPA: hypothetical protein VJT71_15995 [Pyrinomonadaceae bacterium]|nr:hypothetical protein [Pyrinomonadaceae bacterium]